MEALKSRGTTEAFGRPERDALLGHCQAVCDVPAVHFCDELIEAYPEAKVILTVRDFDKWQRYDEHQPRYIESADLIPDR